MRHPRGGVGGSSHDEECTGHATEKQQSCTGFPVRLHPHLACADAAAHSLDRCFIGSHSRTATKQL